MHITYGTEFNSATVIYRWMYAVRIENIILTGHQEHES